MQTQVLPSAERRHWSDDLYGQRRLMPSFERLSSAQLRYGSAYQKLRVLVPILALGLVWLWANKWEPSADINQLSGRTVTLRHIFLACGVAGLWNLWLSLAVFRRESPQKDTLAELRRLFSASVACGALLLFGNVARGLLGRGLFLACASTAMLLFLSYMLLAAFLLVAMASRRVLRKRVALLVGTGRLAKVLRERLRSQYAHFTIYGSVDEEYKGTDPDKDMYLGPLSGLEDILKTQPIEIVLIGLPIKSKYDDIQRTIDICETIGVESQYMLDFFETSRSAVRSHPNPSQNLGVINAQQADPKKFAKRIIDLIGAALLLVLFSPLMIGVALAVRLTSPGPIFFVQQRYGHNRKRFPMFKYRSMVVDAESKQAALESRNEAQGPVFKLKADPRVTRIGAFIRKMSIDEMPQLFNVLRGEMSLVGPRPLPLRDVSRFEEPWLLRRFSVRPGLTCLWQISGRSDTTFDEWIKQDLNYIDNWSLALDAKILFRTVPAVLKGRGAV